METSANETLSHFSEQTDARGRLNLFDKLVDAQPTKEDIAKYYDAWNGTYDGDMSAIKDSNPAQLTKYLDSYYSQRRGDVRILDVGAGTGKGGQLMADLGYANLDALDGSAGMLEKARALGVYRNVFVEFVDVTPLKCAPPDTYDVVVSAGTVYPEHVTGRHLRTLLAVTKIGGKLIFNSAPHDDVGVDVVTHMGRLLNERAIRVLKMDYMRQWEETTDGTTFVFERLS